MNLGELSIIEEQPKDVENIEQKPETPVDNKRVESETTPQEPLQEASNHPNQKSEYQEGYQYLEEKILIYQTQKSKKIPSKEPSSSPYL